MKIPTGRGWFWFAGLVIGLCLVLALPGWFFRPDVWANQNSADQLAGALDRDHAMEQTFTAGRDGLSALDVFGRVPPGRLRAAYTVQLALFEGERQVAAQSVLLSAVQKQPRIHFAFSAQPHSAGQTYRLRIQSDAPADTVSLLASKADIYLDGELRLDGAPAGRDLAFRAFSAVTLPGLAGSVLAIGSRWLLMLAVTLALGLVGAAILVLIGVVPGAGWDEAWLWCLGTGTALTIVLFVGLGMNSLWALALVLGLAAARLLLKPWHGWKIVRPAGLNGFTLLNLLLLFGWSLALRLIQVEDLSAPLWVDGLTHVEMIERILAAGGIPGGLLYHVGFHSLTALLAHGAALPGPGSFSLLGFPLPELTLITGQWIGALSGLALYPFARRVLGGSRAGALAAVLTYSVLAVITTYVFNWGRYPFQLGLLFLPLTLTAGMAFSDRLDAAIGKAGWEGKATVSAVDAWRAGALFLLLGVGMFFSHYGTLAFAGCFFITWLLVERPTWLARLFAKRSGWPRVLAVLAAGLVWAGLLAYLRFGPGFVEEMNGKLQTIVAESIQARDELDYGEIVPLLTRGAGIIVLLAGAAGLALSALRNRRVLALTAGWFAVQALFILVQSPFLGYALASYTNLLLALSLPLSLLAGYAFQALYLEMEKKRRISPRWAITAGVALAVAGGLTLPGLLNSRVMLYGPQDQAALDWITENTPEEAVFLVNSNYWGSSQAVASDGGGWIEAASVRDRTAVRETAFFDHPPSAEEFTSFQRQNQIGYIYLGRFPGFLSADRLDPGAYQKVYEKNGVQIYRVLRP